ncbi:P-II family nitrogen regulator [Oricola indica]|jgi:nitrogen regulatory protein PII|uniref:P-II family nitrogen regulator n=1 Tax=Oricola indica TaxID=2872591 RepID=UPI001CBFD413|nr:P-II family nitrogen regulator [Oricola indica]
MKQLHAKKKIEIIIEQIMADKVIETLEKAGAKGYSIVRKVSGKGNRGIRRGGPLPDVFGNVMIVAIVSEPVAEELLRVADGMLRDTAGIVYVSDVQVLRADHF